MLLGCNSINTSGVQPQGRLPQGYTECEWIGATTTQWINCNYTSSNPKIEIKVKDTTRATNYSYLFGQYISSNHFGLNVASANNMLQYKINNSQGDISSYAYASENVIVMDKSALTINGTSKATYSYTGSISFFGLFGTMNSASSVYNRSRLATMKCLYCKLWDGSTLVRDFVPCLNPSQEVGMFDLVSQTFFSNQGTGTFTYQVLEGGVA